MKPERNLDIDYLRGLSIFVMVWIHTNAYFLSNKTSHFLWDFFEWAVHIFIFCSAYIYFQREFDFSPKALFEYAKKRVTRLVFPYYLFLIPLFALVFIKTPQKLTWDYIYPHFILTGGVDINWLIVLFLFFTAIIPFLSYARKKPVLLAVFTLLSVASSIFFLSGKLPIHYKLTNWLPWSLVIVFTLYFVTFEKRKWFFPATLLGTFIVFLITRQYQIENSHTLLHYYNKYPPNLYHLSYGMFWVTALYRISKLGVFTMQPIKSIFLFLSTYSYSIYFIHILVIYFLTVYLRHIKFDWISFFVVVLLASVALQLLLNKALYFFSMLKKAN